MMEVTRRERERVRNEYTSRSLKIVAVFKKIKKARLRWYGHLKRRNVDDVAREAMKMQILGNRRRGRPKTRWKDRIAADTIEKRLQNKDRGNRNSWRRLIRNSDSE